MLSPKYIRENIEKVKKNTEERGKTPELVDNWVEKDKEFRAKKIELDNLLQERNQISEELKDAEKRTDEKIQRGKDLKDEISTLEKEVSDLEVSAFELIHQIPNIHLESVPVGKSEDDNVVLRTVGEKPTFDFEPKDHLALMQDLDLIDFDAGAKVAGSQFYYLKNEAVELEYALIKFALDKLKSKGFTLVQTPDMARSRYYLGTGYAPKGDEAQTYEIDGEDLGLIATAEVTMAGYHADKLFKEDELPLKYVAISHCFRKEGGSYGKYSKGLYRVHQYTKVEMFIYCLPSQSEAMHEELLAIEEEITRELGIPYLVLEMCTADLGSIAARKRDLEAWMPGRNDYGEITSTSNCTDFQARNLNIKFKDEVKNKNEYVHMLNGTAIALSRLPIAIIENNQNADGSINMPEALHKYLGFKEISSKQL